MPEPEPSTNSEANLWHAIQVNVAARDAEEARQRAAQRSAHEEEARRRLEAEAQREARDQSRQTAARRVDQLFATLLTVARLCLDRKIPINVEMARRARWGSRRGMTHPLQDKSGWLLGDGVVKSYSVPDLSDWGRAKDYGSADYGHHDTVYFWQGFLLTKEAGLYSCRVSQIGGPGHNIRGYTPSQLIAKMEGAEEVSPRRLRESRDPHKVSEIEEHLAQFIAFQRIERFLVPP